MLKKINWPERTAHTLANLTFLLAGYAVGDISVNIARMIA